MSCGWVVVGAAFAPMALGCGALGLRAGALPVAFARAPVRA